MHLGVAKACEASMPSARPQKEPQAIGCGESLSLGPSHPMAGWTRACLVAQGRSHRQTAILKLRDPAFQEIVANGGPRWSCPLLRSIELKELLL